MSERSDDDENASFELGAQYIHSLESELYHIAKAGDNVSEKGMFRTEKDLVNNSDNLKLQVLVSLNGKVSRVPECITSSWLYGATDLIWDITQRMLPQDYGSGDRIQNADSPSVSVADIVGETKNELSKFVESSSLTWDMSVAEKEDTLAKFRTYTSSGITDAFFTQCLKHSYGVRDLSNVSPLTFFWEGDAEEFEYHGGIILVPLKQAGWQQITNELLKRIGNGIFEKEVQIANINTAGKRAILSDSDGTIRYADHVIFTPSIGVLKKHHRNMFTPQLPPNKQLYIDALETSFVEKLFFVYEKDFWSPKPYMTYLLPEGGPPNDPCDISSHMCIINTLPYPWMPPTLQVWLTYPGCEMLEALSDEHLMEAVTKRLKQFAFAPYILYPRKIFRSSWVSNPFIRDSYGSYFTMQFDKTTLSRDDLIDPVMSSEINEKPILQFAGEATADTFMSAHGAYNSGKREAKRIYDYYHSLKR